MLSTTDIFPCDVLVVRFPFSDQSATKARPAAVISTPRFHQLRGEVLILAITSRIESRRPIEPLIKDWEFTGLDKPSVFKAAIATVRSRDIVAKVGELSGRDQENLENLLRTIIFAAKGLGQSSDVRSPQSGL